MPGKAAVSCGLAWSTRRSLPFGINIRSMRGYSKSATPKLTVAELRECRQNLRFAFRIYAIDCANSAPTATERRKTLAKIKTAARRLDNDRTWASAGELLTALDTRDLDARKLVYAQLAANGCDPLLFKKTLLNWSIRSPFPSDCSSVVSELSNLHVEALVPARGRFPDPGLAKAVAALVPIWKKVTSRTAGLISQDREGERKKCPFASWLVEMHGLLDVAQPPVGRVVDIVRMVETQKNQVPIKK